MANEVEHTGVRRCECYGRRVIERGLLVIPPEFRDKLPDDLNDLEPDLKRHKKQGEVIEELQNDPNRSFVFCGKFGSGKTFLAYALYKHMLMNSTYQVHAMSFVDLVRQLREWATGRGEEGQRPKLHSHMLTEGNERRFLFFDDIDKARPTEFVAEEVFNIADAVYTFQHRVVVTTNLEVGELVDHFSRADKRYGGSIIRRLFNKAKVFEMF